MSQDERVPWQIDDGEIHEWLDGELSPGRAREFAALVGSSPQFAARVAEARGLIAASSHILGALDDVPADVLPKIPAPPVVVAGMQSDGASARVARRWSVRRLSGIAALLMVGVTGVVVARREPALSERDALARGERATESAAPEVSMSRQAESAATREQAPVPAPAAAPAAAAPSVAPTSMVASRAQTPASAAAMATATAPTVAPATASAIPSATARAIAPATASAVTSAELQAKASQSRRAEVAAAGTARISVDSPTVAPPMNVEGGRLPQLRTSPPIPGASRAFSGSSVGRSDASTADAGNGIEPQSDIAQADLLLSVQRVQCAPNCVQLRVEVASDGRLRRWRQALGRATIADTATLSATALTSLTQAVATLRLDTLPAVLRLDGAQCRTVGSLRESLRVSFVYNTVPRQVMGLPWCSDGDHVLDWAAQAIEEAASRQLGAVLR